jgi:osmotically-inducible protein OsmY
MNLRPSGRVNYQNDFHFKPSHYARGPKNYYRSDSRIYEDVCEALLNDPNVDAGDIEIEVNDGIVSLRGSVDGRKMKKEAELCIEHIYGIKDIFNMLKLYQFGDEGGKGLIKYQARI